MSIVIDGTGTISGVSATGISSAQTVTSVPSSALPTGSVVQVVQSVITTQITASSNTWTNLTSASITPKSSSNKILILYATNSQAGGNETLTRLLRNATTLPVYTGGDVTNIGMTMGSQGSSSGWGGQSISMQYLDSPATTSSTTYYLQGFQDYLSMSFNRSGGTSAGDSQGGITTLTLMEIVA